jgi:hypothetical protein
MPIGLPPEALAGHVARLGELAREAGRARPEVVVMTSLPLDDPPRAAERARALARAGATRIAHAARYADAAAFERGARTLAEHVRPALPPASQETPA